MDIILSTANLRKLCRICFREGKVHLTKSKIKMPTTGKKEGLGDYETLTVLELIRVFRDSDESILDIVNEMELICIVCLDEILMSYKLYKKLVKANTKAREMFSEAMRLECDLSFTSEIEYLEEENMENPLNTNSNEGTRQSAATDDQDIETEMLEVDQQQECDVAEILDAVVKESAQEESPIFESKETQLIERKKKLVNRKICKTIIGTSMEESSLVVSHFLPSATRVNVEVTPQLTTLTDKVGEPKTATQMHTVDYGPVEVKGSDIGQITQNEPVMSSSSADAATSNDQSLVYMCKYCPQAFSAQSYLMTHLRKSHVCKLCTNAFAKPTDLFEHIKEKHRQHKCAICNKVFTSNSNLRAHLSRVHNVKLPAQVALLDFHPSSTIFTVEQDSNLVIDEDKDDPIETKTEQ